jgi:hypothetical protein
VNALRACGLAVDGTDIANGQDFLLMVDHRYQVIVTNPPYALAQRFIEHAMRLVGNDGMVAMLLRCDFDHAKSRQHLFGQCPEFWKKIVLTKRIRWFENSIGSPSFNHAWYVWKMGYRGPATLEYARA